MTTTQMPLSDWEAKTPSEKQKYLFDNRLYLNRFINREGFNNRDGKIVKGEPVFVEFQKHDKDLVINKEAYEDQLRKNLAKQHAQLSKETQ